MRPTAADDAPPSPLPPVEWEVAIRVFADGRRIAVRRTAAARDGTLRGRARIDAVID